MSAKNQHQLNLEIEALIKSKGANYSYTDDEKKLLRMYEGSGGQGKHGATGEGVLYEFFTPQWLCEKMWQLAIAHGYDGGNVLEPSIATGRLIDHAPDKSKCVGFEINPVSAAICKIMHPESTVYNGYFETAFLQPDRFTNRITKQLTWLEEYPFSLVIGNPPYGKYKNKYSGYFPNPKMAQIELFFMYYGLKLLKSGGLLVYLVSSNFMRNGVTYNREKSELAKMADIIDAYRLPEVFPSSQINTDIIIFRKK